MNSPCFELCSVSKFYDGHPVLSEVSFTIVAGQHSAILGSSGCGKSTLLRLLAGLDAPSSGRILLDGTVISETNAILMPPHCRSVAMVFQDLALWPNLSVMENVILGLSGAKLAKSRAFERAKEALALCGIETLSDRMPGHLSGGQQQRAALARAIAVRSDFLFLDEPFGGLDLVTRTALVAEISKLAEAQRFTIVLVTHDPQEATTLCRSAIVLNQGRVEESGSLNDLLHNPQSEILRVFGEYLRGLISISRP